MKETWRDIPGYGGKYQIDREGNVRRVYASGAGGRKAELHELPDGDGPVQRQGERCARARRICVCVGRQRSQHKACHAEDRKEGRAEEWVG